MNRLLTFPAEPLARFEEALSWANEVIAGLGTENIPSAVGALERMKTVLLVRLLGSSSMPNREQPDMPLVLRVKEAALLLGMSPSALYKAADTYPFSFRDGRRLSFSRRGIEKWIAQRTGP